MKRKILLIASSLLLLAVAIAILDKLEIINPPSAEMSLLRKTEKTLALPPNFFQRSEDDKGCYRDSKGAAHCDRSIFFYYKSDQYWPDLQAKLKQLGWKSFDDGGGGYRAWNNQANAPVCLDHSDATVEEGSYLTLSAATDEHCKYIMQQL